MATKSALPARFRKELAVLQARWPNIKISARDRVKWNETMLKINERQRKKRKKALAT